jgi:hypothetical protein
MPLESVGDCDLHGREVREGEFERKGCWNCHHFGYSEGFQYIDVLEAAQLLEKSPSTIRNWLNSGRLKGKLFMRKRPDVQAGSPKKWLVSKENFNLFKHHHK